jgi:hypothetical protein
MAEFLPGRVLAQKDDEATTFPLENFYAKIKNHPRSIFRNVKFSLSTGYGNTFFSHDLKGFDIYQAPGQQPSIFISSSPTTGHYTNWVNQSNLDTSPVVPGSFIVSSSSASLGFKGNALNIPLKATIHYEWGGRYRIGGGYSYELMSIGSMHPTSFSDQIRDFQPSQSSGWMSRYFGLIGVSFYRMGNYLFTGDVQAGNYSPGSNFNAALITTSVYINGGVTIERELSEYLRVFVRPSYEIKSYTLNLPEGGPGITHNINAFYLNVGLTYSIPELPKCFIPGCKIQMNHAHGDREYRSRVHPIYKKQNPQYGENHPELIKYKGKNKRKMNPY